MVLSERLRHVIGLCIAIFTIPMIISTLQWSNTTSDTINYAVNVTNTWAFYQAKTTRQVFLQIAAENLEILLKVSPQITDESQKMIEKRIDKIHGTVDRYQSAPETNDGKNELMARAKDLEKKRDQSNRQSSYFGYAMVMLQIAIILSTAALTAGVRFLFVLSLMFSAAGVVVMLDGFYLFATIPFLD